MRLEFEKTDPTKARALAEAIGRLVVKAQAADALAALKLNVARIYIEENTTPENAMRCADVFGEGLSIYVAENWHAKRRGAK